MVLLNKPDHAVLSSSHFSGSPLQMVQLSSAPIPPQLPWMGLLLNTTPIDNPKKAKPRIIIDK